VINLLPEVSETLVVALERDEVLRRLSEVTANRLAEVGRTPKVLAGWVQDDRFQLIIRQRRLNSFMPMVEGKIDPTSSGCLIFFRYRLMPMTRMYLVLWTIIAVLSGVFLTIYYNNIFIGLASLGIIALIHGIAWGNFRIHQRPLREIIFKVLS
jgi:hypothetical protein